MFEIDKRILRPELFLQFLACDQFARAVQQYLQNGKRLTLQADMHSFLAQFPGVGVELVRTEGYDDRFCWTRHSDDPFVDHREVYSGSEAHNRHVTARRKTRFTNYLRCHLGFTRIALTFGGL